MENILILTDFSEAAFRAAAYACELSGKLGTKQIILYHAIQTFVTGTEIPVVADSRQIYRECMEKLGMLSDRIKVLAGYDIRIRLLAEDSYLPANINRLCHEEDIDLIVMGFSGKSGFEKLVLGSTTLRVLEESKFPVLMVPPDMQPGKGITTVIFATDLKDFSAVPGSRLCRILDIFKADLHVINVSQEEETYSNELKDYIAGLHKLLEKYDPVFHYVSRDNIAEGILSMGELLHTSIIITIHREHNFLYSIFHKSVFRELIRRSSFPILSLPGLSADPAGQI